MNRRSLLFGFGSLIASPVIVRASSLMPISPLDPAWITNHQNTFFGEFVARLPNARNFERFSGLIKPGQFFWRKDGQLVDVCWWPKTQLDITPTMISVQNNDISSPEILQSYKIEKKSQIILGWDKPAFDSLRPSTQAVLAQALISNGQLPVYSGD